MTATHLRHRFLAALVASGVVSAACGGSTESSSSGGQTSSSGGSSGASSSSGGSSSGVASSGGTSTSSSSSSSTSGAPSKPPVCRDGRSETQCFTHAELDAQWRSPGMAGGDPKPGEAPFLANGCLAKEDVRDGCCNPAATDASLQGDTCCYTFCTGACCGRPFVVGGETRLPRIVDRDDWRRGGDTAAIGLALDPFTRARLASAWAADAAMEHASVAAFARFTLELCAHGAPPELLLAAQAATRDEIEHARACFAIASRYADRALGPSALDVRGADASRPLAEVVAAVVVEGCIGETLSALLAEARLAQAEDPEVRATLARIATEEAAHAETAWRFVAWAIAEGGAPVRAAVSRAFEHAPLPDPFDPALEGVSATTLRRHGLLDARTARAVARHALTQVIRPCVAALASNRELAA